MDIPLPLRFGDYELDKANALLRKDGQPSIRG
jgi:hypothetical protein